MSPPSGPPLDPSNEEAHSWLADELSKSRYDTPPDFFGWLGRLIDRLLPTHVGGVGLPGWVVPVVTTVVLVVAAILVLRAGNMDLRRRRPKSGSFVDDPTLTAADYRRLSAEAEAEGNWDMVVLQSFRALAVSATERTLLDDRPGRTAREVVVELGPVFPTCKERMSAAADVFDLVRYGGRSTTRDAALAMRQLDDEVRLTRPSLIVAELPE